MFLLIFFLRLVSIILLISWVRSLEKKIYYKSYGLHEAENTEEADWQIWNPIGRFGIQSIVAVAMD